MDDHGRISRALIIANPIAGRGRGERVGRLVAEALRRRGVPAEVYLTGAMAGRACGAWRRVGAWWAAMPVADIFERDVRLKDARAALRQLA